MHASATILLFILRLHFCRSASAVVQPSHPLRQSSTPVLILELYLQYERTSDTHMMMEGSGSCNGRDGSESPGVDQG